MMYTMVSYSVIPKKLRCVSLGVEPGENRNELNQKFIHKCTNQVLLSRSVVIPENLRNHNFVPGDKLGKDDRMNMKEQHSDIYFWTSYKRMYGIIIAKQENFILCEN